jgi:hypothetical protein
VSDEIKANLALKFNKVDLSVADSGKLGKDNPTGSLLDMK